MSDKSSVLWKLDQRQHEKRKKVKTFDRGYNSCFLKLFLLFWHHRSFFGAARLFSSFEIRPQKASRNKSFLAHLGVFRPKNRRRSRESHSPFFFTIRKIWIWQSCMKNLWNGGEIKRVSYLLFGLYLLKKKPFSFLSISFLIYCFLGIVTSTFCSRQGVKIFLRKCLLIAKVLPTKEN